MRWEMWWTALWALRQCANCNNKWLPWSLMMRHYVKVVTFTVKNVLVGGSLSFGGRRIQAPINHFSRWPKWFGWNHINAVRFQLYCQYVTVLFCHLGAGVHRDPQRCVNNGIYNRYPNEEKRVGFKRNVEAETNNTQHSPAKLARLTFVNFLTGNCK